MSARRVAIFLSRRSEALLIGALVLAAFTPRAGMALLRPVLCTDAVYFIERARALEHGAIEVGLHDLRLNLYPYLLLAGHRLTGLDEELFGRWWSVSASSLVAWPLFVLTRRLLDRRAAVATCLLYAFHPETIEWSPEVIRDPTFWLLATTAMALARWSVDAPSLRAFLLTGLALTGAILTRFEGWLFWLPLIGWSAGRAWGDARARRRLACGLILVGLTWPAVVGAFNLTLLRERSEWELGRFAHVQMAENWLQDRRDTFAERIAHPVEGNDFSLRTMVWGYRHTLLLGWNPLWLALAVAGWWGVHRRRPVLPLLLLDLVTLGVLASVWIYLWNWHVVTKRYFLLPVLLTAPYAGWAVWQLAERIAKTLRERTSLQHAWPSWARAARWAPGSAAAMVAAVLLAVTALVGVGDAWTSPYESRYLRADLGRWIERNCGRGRRLVLSPNLDRLVGYYAHAQHRWFPQELAGRELATWVADAAPDYVVLWMRPPGPDLYCDLWSEPERFGFERWQPAVWPQQFADARLLRRREEHWAGPILSP